MTKIYISGPMSGIKNFNYESFAEAESRLRHLGEVVNPAKIEPSVKTWEGYMRADIKALVDCDAVYVLPGWENSKGARIEIAIAVGLGMDIYDYETMTQVFFQEDATA